MKNLILLFTLLLILCFSINSLSQVTVTVPPGNDNDNSVRNPFGCYYGYERTANLYTSADVGQNGYIFKIAFYVNSVVAPQASTPIVVKMIRTSATSLVPGQYLYTGASTVYSGNVIGSDLVANSWYEVTLDSPFNFAGANLLVLIETNYGGTGGEGITAKQFRRSLTSETKFQYWQSDNSPPTGLGTISDSRNNIQLTFDTKVSCMATIVNQIPTGTITPECNDTTIAPKVKVNNPSVQAHSNLSVRYRVTEAGYDETVTGLGILGRGGSIIVNFPETLVLSSNDPGVKNVIVDVTATCAGGPVDYTLNTNFNVSAVNVNFGGPVSGYYFANSTDRASCAPDQPLFYWEDTTGSISLIEGGVDVSGGLLTGDLDDGFFNLDIGMNGSNSFMYGGVAYDSLIIGTNGMIAFSKANNTQSQLTTSAPLAIPSASAPRPAIFPLWKNLRFYTGFDCRLSYKINGGKLIITYSKAPNYNGTAGDPNDYVSFQVVLEVQNFAFSGVLDGLIIVNYDDTKTSSVFLNKYNITTLETHTVGQQNLAGDEAIQYRRATPAVVVPGPLFSSPVAVSYGPNNNVLPVELASFTASTNKNDVTLNWATDSETNNSGFDIERSSATGGIRNQTSDLWTKIGNVEGNGNSSVGHNYTFYDRNLTSGLYSYRLKQIDFNGNFEYYNLSSEVNVGIPAKYYMSQNYPNPFNPSTKINFEIPLDGKVSLKIFDISGKEVMTLVNEVKTAGYYTVSFNASDLSSGIYFYTISTGDFVSTKKMTLIK